MYKYSNQLLPDVLDDFLIGMDARERKDNYYCH